MFDLTRLGDWRNLPFFDETLPGIVEKLNSDPRGFLPAPELVFAALEATQPDDVKAVILGQDPYPQPGKAQGIAFSIHNAFPPRRHRDSLDNIFEELRSDLNISRNGTSLNDWTDKGVLMFNCLALTVPENKAGGHRALGWKTLTAQVLSRLQDSPRAYLLWGGDAHKAAANLDAAKNLVIKSSHPSPMGVAKSGETYEAFRGSRPFSRVNDWLQARGEAAINWANPAEDA